MKKKSKAKQPRVVDRLVGYAVTFMGGLHHGRFFGLAAIKEEGKPVRLDDVCYRTEFWLYDPALLTVKQRKLLKIVAWKKIDVKVRLGDGHPDASRK